MAATRAATPKRRFSRPVFDETITIQSDHAQRLIERGLFQVASALYAIDVILRIIGDGDAMDDIETLVNASLVTFAADLAKELQRLEALRVQHGVTRIPRYEGPRTLTIHVHSPQMSQYCALILSLDQLMIAIDTLWMNGVIGSKQRVNGCFAWRVRLLRIGREFVNLERRARAAATRQGRGEEVEAEHGDAPVVVDQDADADADAAAADAVRVVAA